MGQLSLTGSLTVGPVIGGDNVFPSSQSQVPLASYPAQKSSAVDGGFQHQNVSSPNAFVALSGLNTTDAVSQADTLYFKCQNPMQIRVTFAGNSPTVSVLFVQGTVIIEAPTASNYMTLLEVMGTGPIEYLVSGQR